jgi:polar amino acid transport system ATP-binding protein
MTPEDVTHSPSVEAAPARDDSTVMRATDIRKSFAGREVVRGISLDVKQREVVCIIGPSGSGKTTFLRCINQLEVPDSGTVWVDGERIGFRELEDGSFRRHSERGLCRQRRKIGFVFQQFNLFPHRTALENIIEAPVRVLGTPRDQAIHEAMELLKRVGLADKAKSYPGRLSGGQQQRVAIARALAMQPVLMLFDEPTSALDPETVGEVVTVMEELAHRMTMIVVTHEMGFARRAADRVVMIDHGAVIEEAEPEKFFNAPEQARSREFLSKMLH